MGPVHCFECLLGWHSRPLSLSVAIQEEGARVRDGKWGGEGAERAGLWGLEMGPGCGAPAQATSGTVIPPYVAYRAPLHPLSQNSCELAGQGPHFTDRETKAPRQEGICPESQGWSVAKVEFGSRGWGGRKLMKTPWLHTPHHWPQRPILHRMAIECHPSRCRGGT